MPTYEYACKDCGEHLEVVQSFKDDALTTCPNCQGNLRKVFSAAGIIFKGSGWHIKDYKDAGKKPAAASSDSSSDKATSETTSSDSSSDASTAKSESTKPESSKPADTSTTKSSDSASKSA